MEPDFRAACLTLLRRDLTRYGMRESAPADWPLRRKVLLHAVNTGNLLRAGVNPFGRRKRELGLDWPPEAITMIGWRRLESLEHCVESVLNEGIRGDLVECGVWRGGASVLMKAVLEAFGDTDRSVWLADSFEGLPAPDAEKYHLDRNLRLDRYRSILGVSEEQVRANFRRYGLLDDRVRFLPGWFKDTLHRAPIDEIAVLRLDGDLYESTTQALEALYPKLSPGGFCIVDDYGAIEACKHAVTDYRERQGLTEEIVDIDGSGVYWRRRSNRPLDASGTFGARRFDA